MRTSTQSVWPFDDRHLVAGEHVRELDQQRPEIIKQDPADVITVAEASRLVDPDSSPQPLWVPQTLRTLVDLPVRRR